MLENKAQAPLLETLVRAMPEQEASCREWNDALTYLGGGESCSTAEKARTALLELLGSPA